MTYFVYICEKLFLLYMPTVTYLIEQVFLKSNKEYISIKNHVHDKQKFHEQKNI